MANDVLSLFNMPTQEQLGRSYLEGMLTSPQQLGAQSLLQQVVSLGGNAGAGIGYGVGRLMGGMTADEVRAKSIDDAMRTVQGMGLGTDADMYAALSKELANRGLTQDSLKAREASMKAMKEEEAIRASKIQADAALAEIGQKADAARRAETLFPMQQQELELKVQAAQKALTPIETRLGLAAEKEASLRTSAPNSPEYKRALEDVTALSREYQDARNAAMLDIQKTQAQINAYEAQRRKALSDIDYNTARAAQDAFTGKLVTQYTNPMTQRAESLEVGKPSKGGKIQGLSSGKIYTMDEWSEGGGYIKEANAIRKANKLPPLDGQETPAGGGNKEGNKNIKGVLESLYGGAQQGNQAPSPNQPQATATLPVPGLEQLKAIDQQIAQAEAILQTVRRSGDQRAIAVYTQGLADLQNQKRVIASQVGR